MVRQLLKDGDKDAAYAILREAPQPGSWIEKGLNHRGEEYFFNRIQVIEEVMYAMFGHCPLYILSSNNHISKFACVTTQVSVEVPGLCCLHGIASVMGDPDLMPMLTPKSVSMAYKNACARLGRLLGRDLNRNEEDKEEVIIKNAPLSSLPADQAMDSFLYELRNAQSAEDAQLMLDSSPYKYSVEARLIIKNKQEKEKK